MADDSFATMINNVLIGDKAAFKKLLIRTQANDFNEDEVLVLTDLIKKSINDTSRRAQAAFLLALGLDIGIDGQANKQLALGFYIEAVNSGHAHAMYRLALLSLQQGIPTSYGTAAFLLDKAIDLGETEALFARSALYLDMGIVGDSRKALELYQQYLQLTGKQPDSAIKEEYDAINQDRIELAPSLDDLFAQIYHLEDKGKTLKKEQADLVHFYVEQLLDNLNEFLVGALGTKISVDDVNVFKQEFTELLQSKASTMTEFGIDWASITANMLSTIANIDFIDVVDKAKQDLMVVFKEAPAAA